MKFILVITFITQVVNGSGLPGFSTFSYYPMEYQSKKKCLETGVKHAADIIRWSTKNGSELQGGARISCFVEEYPLD